MLTEQVCAFLDQNPGIKAVIICGVETHICVQATCLKLLHLGYEVHVVVDAVSGRTRGDHAIALDRMRASGAFITTVESALFALLADDRNPQFLPVFQLLRPVRIVSLICTKISCLSFQQNEISGVD